eukprot:286695-Pelagomonas_calceolata.AAC.1
MRGLTPAHSPQPSRTPQTLNSYMPGTHSTVFIGSHGRPHTDKMIVCTAPTLSQPTTSTT